MKSILVSTVNLFCLFYFLCFTPHYCNAAVSYVTNCDMLLQQYVTIQYPVNDCFDDKANNFTYWRIDRKLAWLDARQACSSAGANADLAIIQTSADQRILNDLYAAKVTPNSWMWLGIRRNDQGNLTWVDGTNITQSYRWYPYPDSRSHNCGVMLVLSDPNGDQDVAGTFWYTEDCSWTYISACMANVTAAQ